jgi:hypothetical protein
MVIIAPVGSATNGAATGTDANVTHGLTILNKDVVLAFVGSNVGSGGGITDNNGATPFTADFDAQCSGAADSWALIAHRVSAGSEPSAYHWTVPNTRWSVIIRVFRYVHADVWDVAGAPSPSPAFGAGTTATADAIAPVTNDTLGLLFVVADDGALTFSGPTNGYADEVERTDQAQVTYTKYIEFFGDTGTAAVTLSASDDWQAWQMALKAGSVPSGPTRIGYPAAWKRLSAAQLDDEDEE